MSTSQENSFQGVLRERLLGRLSPLSPLTLLSAPAGYGKTALTRSWLATTDTGRTIVDTALDEDAVDPRRFWTSVLDAMKRAGVDVSEVTITRGGHDDLRPLVQRLAAHPQGVVWLLDTDEFSISPGVGRTLEWLLRRCSGGLSIVLMTRTDPPLPVHRLRLEDAVTDIRARDLAFTVDEAAALLASRDFELSPADAAVLHARTGGWPAGLIFAVMPLKQAEVVQEALDAFRGDTGNVAEYLLSEVLAGHGAEARRFLLHSSVADELEPGLVEALTGQPCDLATLEAMALGNNFLELVPGRSDRYRYQLLFREFLRGQLAAESAELVGELQQVNAQWLAEDGRVFAAIRHAAQAHQWPTATRLLVERLRFVSLLVGSRNERLHALFRAAPSDLPGATGSIARAALSISELDLTGAHRHLQEARQLVAREPGPPDPTHVLAVAVLTAAEASLGGDVEAGLRAVVVADRALRTTPSRDLDAQVELSAVLDGCKARLLVERGELEAAAEALSHGIKAAESGRLDGVTYELKGLAALVAALLGRLRRATDLAREVLPELDDPDEDVVGPGVGAAALALAWVRTDESLPHTAAELVAHAGRQPASYDSRILGAVLAFLRARLLGDEGHHELALVELQGAREAEGRAQLAAPVTGWLHTLLVVGEAEALLGLGRPRAAVTILEETGVAGHAAGERLLHRAQVAAGGHGDADLPPESPAAEGPLPVLVDRWLLSAEMSLERRSPARAARSLARALRIAGPEHLRRPFVRAGEDLRALLEHSGLAERNGWLHRPVPGPVVEPAGAGPLIPLTRKEEEVLEHLAELLTTDEIATTMYVSVNTVRSHVRSILRKLGANRRNEAVRRAWQLGLLPLEDPTSPQAVR